VAFTKAARPRHRVDGAEARALDEIADRVGAVARSSSRPTQGRAGNGVTCDACGAPLAPKPGSRRQRYCGSACRQARYRARKRARRCKTPAVTIKRLASPAALPVEIVGGGFRWAGSARPEITTLIDTIINTEIGGCTR